MATKYCPYCGDKVSADAKCCPTCGIPLSPTAPAEQPVSPAPQRQPASQQPYAQPQQGQTAFQQPYAQPSFQGAPVPPRQESHTTRNILLAGLAVILLMLAGMAGFGYWIYKTVAERPNATLVEGEQTDNAVAADSVMVDNGNTAAASQENNSGQETPREVPAAPQPQETTREPMRTEDAAPTPNNAIANDLQGTLSCIDTADRTMTFTLNGRSGSYYFSGSDNVPRDLQLESYNPATGSLTYKAYLRGRYIGKFKGTLRFDGHDNERSFYDCTFISVNGARINYSLDG